MEEINGDIWDLHAMGYWVVVPTNGNTDRDGRAVMGAGVALQAAIKFPEIRMMLGNALAHDGNQVYVFPKQRVITFPTKNHWKNDSEYPLIHRSAQELQRITKSWLGIKPFICSPKLGCGLGNLDWNAVKEILDTYLEDKIIIVNKA
jgi:hypothetical protein